MTATSWIPVFASLVLALLPAGAARTSASATHALPAEQHFPLPSAALRVPAPGELGGEHQLGGEQPLGGPTLLWLVEELARVGGVPLQASADCRARLAQVRLGLFGAVDLPPAELWSFAESLLWSNRFALEDARRASPALVRVVPLDGEERLGLLGSALEVPLQRIALYEDHPALLVRTFVPLPHVDPRTLTNALRALLAERDLQVLVPTGAGPSGGVVVLANGRSAARLTRLLQQIDAAEGSLSADSLGAGAAEKR